MEIEGEPLDVRAEPALQPLGPLEADVAKRSDVVAPDRDGKPVHVLSLGGPDASIGETMDSHGCPYRFDYAERPRTRDKTVDARKCAAAGEREDKAAVTALQRVHEHHEGERAYAESGKQASVTSPGTSSLGHMYRPN